MEAQELPERLVKILSQNEPKNCQGTMPKDLEEVFDKFALSCAREWAPRDEHLPIVPVLAATLTQGFWLGHDYALEHGQLRGD